MLEMAQVDRNMVPAGRALEAAPPRSAVFLETKCWGSMGFEATIAHEVRSI